MYGDGRGLLAGVLSCSLGWTGRNRAILLGGILKCQDCRGFSVDWLFDLSIGGDGGTDHQSLSWVPSEQGGLHEILVPTLISLTPPAVTWWPGPEPAVRFIFCREQTCLSQDWESPVCGGWGRGLWSDCLFYRLSNPPPSCFQLHLEPPIPESFPGFWGINAVTFVGFLW